MIKFTKDENYDHRWLNREINEHLGDQKFTKKQEAAIKNVIDKITDGYRRTISRMEWGPGWD